MAKPGVAMRVCATKADDFAPLAGGMRGAQVARLRPGDSRRMRQERRRPGEHQ